MKARTLALLAGLATLLVAIRLIDDERLPGHMIQHLLLVDVAPPLLLAGRPAQIALMSLPSRPRRCFGRVIRPRRSVGRVLVAVSRRAHPAVCLTLFAVLVLGCHVPAVFDAAARHPALHALQHGAFLAAGLIVWWPLLGAPNPRGRLGTVAQLIYLLVAMLPMTLLGAYLDRAQTLFYPAYAGPGAVASQQQAGAIMWVAGTAVMALLGIAGVMAAMLEAEHRQRLRELREVAR